MSEAQGRYDIFQVAYAQFGAHYLRGAWGGIPGGPAIFGERSVNLRKDPAWDTLRVCSGSNSCGTCYGRWANLNGKGYLFQPGTSKLTRLKEWVETYRDYPIESWPPFDSYYGMTPRRLHGSGSAIAMGEDCRGKRHFDCIGFIFWVLNEVVPNSSWTKNIIINYERGIYKTVGNTKVWKLKPLGRIPKSQLKYGDIVTRTSTDPHHIGIASEDGKVVHASREGTGVVCDPYEDGNWTNVSRIDSSLFS